MKKMLLAAMAATMVTAASAVGLPTDAQDGKCFVQEWVAPTFETKYVKVLVKEAWTETVVVPAVFEKEEKTKQLEASSYWAKESYKDGVKIRYTSKDLGFKYTALRLITPEKVTTTSHMAEYEKRKFQNALTPGKMIWVESDCGNMQTAPAAAKTKVQPTAVKDTPDKPKLIELTEAPEVIEAPVNKEKPSASDVLQEYYR